MSARAWYQDDGSTTEFSPTHYVILSKIKSTNASCCQIRTNKKRGLILNTHFIKRPSTPSAYFMTNSRYAHTFYKQGVRGNIRVTSQTTKSRCNGQSWCLYSKNPPKFFYRLISMLSLYDLNRPNFTRTQVCT